MLLALQKPNTGEMRIVKLILFTEHHLHQICFPHPRHLNTALPLFACHFHFQMFCSFNTAILLSNRHWQKKPLLPPNCLHESPQISWNCAMLSKTWKNSIIDKCYLTQDKENFYSVLLCKIQHRYYLKTTEVQNVRKQDLILLCLVKLCLIVK